MNEFIKVTLAVWEFIKQNQTWLIALFVPIIPIYVSHREFSRKLKHEVRLAEDRMKHDFEKVENDHKLQQKRQKNEFITKLTFDNLTEFLEIAPTAVRETQFYLADDIIRYMDAHKGELDAILIEKVVASELFRKINEEGKNFSVETARAQNLLIYASDENRKRFSDALGKLNGISLLITTYFVSGEFDKLRSYIKPYPAPAGLVTPLTAVLEAIDQIRNELNLMINEYRE